MRLEPTINARSLIISCGAFRRRNSSVFNLDTQDIHSVVNYSAEFLHTMTPTGMSTQRVALKIGILFILPSSINPASSLFNYAHCFLLITSPRVLHVEIATRQNAGKTALTT